MGLTDSYAYFLPVHALYQIVSIKLCHNSITRLICAALENKEYAGKT